MGDPRPQSKGQPAPCCARQRADIQVKVIHELCEWQLENPARFRALLKTEDEEATWVCCKQPCMINSDASASTH